MPLSVIDFILESAIIAVVRTRAEADLLPAAEAVRAGGITAVEFTLTSPGALDALKAASRQLGDGVVLGAGTVLDPETARAAILAGARFLVSPTLNLDLIRLARRYGVPAIPGAFTPTEILTAWENGAELVKVFPAGRLGPGYLKDILSPLPQVRLVPTGGVTPENAADFIRAGAVAVAVGGALTSPQGAGRDRWAAVTEAARTLVQSVNAAREGGP